MKPPTDCEFCLFLALVTLGEWVFVATVYAIARQI